MTLLWAPQTPTACAQHATEPHMSALAIWGTLSSLCLSITHSCLALSTPCCASSALAATGNGATSPRSLPPFPRCHKLAADTQC